MAKSKKNRGKKTQKNHFLKNVIFILAVIAFVLLAQHCRSNGTLPDELAQFFDSITSVQTQTQSESTTPSFQSENQDALDFPKGLEIPVCAGNHGAKDHQRRDFLYYSLCYRESYEQAEWSAYVLDSSNLVKNASRSNDFREDPEIKTGSATLKDYKSSGYDRGHLTPAADMSFSSDAMSETFYMSNMSPQAGAFNRGIWRLLEEQVRVWAQKFSRVYVVSGPILDKSAGKFKKIGASNVSVPEKYYKVVLAKSGNDVLALGFIIPNDECKGKKFWDFAVSVDEVEKATALDFFSLLDDKTENVAESSFDLALWK